MKKYTPKCTIITKSCLCVIKNVNKTVKYITGFANHAFHLSILEAEVEAGRSLCVLHSEFQADGGYILKPCLKKQNNLCVEF